MNRIYIYIIHFIIKSLHEHLLKVQSNLSRQVNVQITTLNSMEDKKINKTYSLPPKNSGSIHSETRNKEKQGKKTFLKFFIETFYLCLKICNHYTVYVGDLIYTISH